MTWSESVESYLKQHSASTAALYSRGLARFCQWYVDHYEEEPDSVLLTDEELLKNNHLEKPLSLRGCPVCGKKK